ncbi:hypothetical protein BH09VER1_BH09VER1_47060 [soil metagenome]
MKRTGCLLVFTVLFFVLQAMAASPTEVTMMLPPNDRARPVWQKLSEEFNRTHSDVRFRIIWSDISQKIHLLTAAESLPDLVQFPDFRLATYHSILLDLGPFLETQSEAEQQYFPSLLKVCEYDGKLKLIPFYFNVPFVYYRPDLFRKAGLPLPNADWTWEDYRRDALALTEKGPDGWVKVYGTNIQMDWWVEWLSLVRQAGGDLMDSAGHLKIGGKETLTALEFMHDMIYLDESAPRASFAPTGGFFSGRYGLYYGGHVSELSTLREHADFEWDIAPLPAGPAGRATGDLAVGGLGIWKGCQNPKAAFEVLSFLMSHPASVALCGAGLAPVRQDVAREVLLAGTPETRSAPRHPEVLIDTLTFASSVPKLRDFAPLAIGCITPEISRALNDPNREHLQSVPANLEALSRNYLGTLGRKSGGNPLFFAAQILLLVLIGGWLLLRYLRNSPPTEGSRRATRCFFAFSAPCLLGMALFTLGPLVLSFWWAQTDYDLVNPASYVGLAQYKSLLFEDPDFWHSLILSLIYAAIHVPLSLILSLAAALLLNQEVKHIGIFRTIFYLPSILPVAASGMMWAWFLHPRYGVVNGALEWLGIPGPGWLQDPHWALPALLIISLWGFGGAMLIFLAGLKNIPGSLYEAAEIDGAGPVSRFFHITLPSLAPVLFFNLTMGIIGALQIFDLAFVVTGGNTAIGGPEKSLYFYVLNLYEKSFVHLNIGVGSAMAWLFFLIVALITAVNFWARRYWWKEQTA